MDEQVATGKEKPWKKVHAIWKEKSANGVTRVGLQQEEITHGRALLREALSPDE